MAFIKTEMRVVSSQVRQYLLLLQISKEEDVSEDAVGTFIVAQKWPPWILKIYTLFIRISHTERNTA